MIMALQGASRRPGADADSPWRMPWPAWKDILRRTVSETSKDNISLISAGVAFYGFGALVPVLAAIVLGYGLLADPATVVHDMQKMMAVMPADAAKLIAEQLLTVVGSSSGKKGFGIFLALAIALYGARNGVSAILTALNVAYEEKEERSFVRQLLLSLALTVGAVLIAIVALLAIAALGHLEALIGDVPGIVVFIGKLLSYALLVLAAAAGAATLYRYGPDRSKAKWVWITPGSLLTAVLWLLLTLGFGLYVADFGHYNATYGSLGAVVIFLTWLYLSAYVFLIGAELNSEVERQTSRQTQETSASVPGAPASIAIEAPGAREQAGSGRALSATTMRKDVATIVGVSRAAPLVGLSHIGLIPAIIAAAGLAALRQEGRARLGWLLLGAGGSLAWLGHAARRNRRTPSAWE
jgi:membrane protein